MPYKENPKTKGSGVICAIPQKGTCPINCDHCFFQTGRSFLEPLDENTPNMPPLEEAEGRIVRVNDGNDSNYRRPQVIERTAKYTDKFFNTSILTDIQGFPGPVVLTINPGRMTDERFHQLPFPPKNLMFVRIRVNTWNLDMVRQAVEYYSRREVPIVLTFMAYHDEESIPAGVPRADYVHRKRTSNEYWAISTDAWRRVMEEFQDNKWVYSCSKIEGERGTSACSRCGNCIREYFNTKERLRA